MKRGAHLIIELRPQHQHIGPADARLAQDLAGGQHRTRQAGEIRR
jgi:hypothetical protein